MSMHSLAIIFGSLITFPILYLTLARRISMLVDFILPGPPIPHPTDPMSIQFDPEGISSRFTLGSWNWPFSWPDAPGPFDLKILLTRQNHLLLRAGVHTFTLGRATSAAGC